MSFAKFCGNIDEAIRFGSFEEEWKSAKRILDYSSAIYLIGNGGSHSIATHIANDITKNLSKPARVIDQSTLSCLANDYKWQHALSEWISVNIMHRDILIAISSSGESKNILNACRSAKTRECRVITLSGFEIDNQLSKMGDVNFYVPSDNYGIVEIVHLTILHSLVNPG